MIQREDGDIFGVDAVQEADRNEGGTMRTSPHQAPQPEQKRLALHVLIYRYLFFDWVFRDVDAGSSLERAAAWRFNREMRRVLPIYLRRWVMLLACSYALGAIFEKWLAQGHAATLFYCVSSAAIAMSVLIARLWLGLRFG